MKKLILFAALLVMSARSFAQPSYGVKGGLNLSNISGFSELEDGLGIRMKIKPSIYIGVFGEFRINDFLGIAPEVVYSRQGTSFGLEGGDLFDLVDNWMDYYYDMNIRVKMRINYLNVPVMLKFYVADGLSFDMGPQFGFLLNAKIWAGADGESDSSDITESFNTFDLSVGMGLTYNFNRFLVQGRYNLGLTGIVDEDGSNPHNNVFQLGLGYRF